MRVGSRLAWCVVAAGLFAGCGDDDSPADDDDDVPVPDATPEPADAMPAPDAPGAACFDEATALAPGNLFGVDPELGDALSADAPDFLPGAGSPALSGAASPPGGFFDADSDFYGALGGDEDWTAGWTSYPNGETPPDETPIRSAGITAAAAVERSGE